MPPPRRADHRPGLHLPLASADAGERYLHALEEVDRYAHAAQTALAPPASHQAIRRWYVQALVDQLRAAAQGLPQPVEQLPAGAGRRGRLVVLAPGDSNRLQLLQRVTTELTSALTVTDVAVTVVNQASAFPGWRPQGSARSRTIARCVPGLSRWDQGGVDPCRSLARRRLPGAVAGTGESLVLRGRAQIYERFPLLTGYYPTERSLHVAPLRVGEHTLGLLTLSFVAGEVTDDAQQAFVKAVAGALARRGRSPRHRVGRSRDADGHAGQRPLVVPRHGVGRPVLQPRAPRDGRHRDRPAGAPVAAGRAHHGHGQPSTDRGALPPRSRQGAGGAGARGPQPERPRAGDGSAHDHRLRPEPVDCRRVTGDG